MGRGLPLWSGITLCLLLPAWAFWSSTSETMPGSIAGLDAGNTPGLLRQGLWGSIGSFMLIAATWKGSRAGYLFANRDRSWLSTRLDSAVGGAFALVVGGVFAAAIALLGLAAGVEFASALGPAQVGQAFGKEHALHGQSLVLVSATPDNAMEAAWIVGDAKERLDYVASKDVPAPQLSFMPTSLAGDGPSALITISAARIADGKAVAEQTTSLTVRVRGTRRVLLPIPEGSGQLLITVRHGEDGPPLRLSGEHSALLLPRASHHLASLALWQHAFLWIAGAGAIALGLGARLGAGLGMSLALAIQVAGLGPAAGTYLGGSVWLDVLATAGQGFVPSSWTAPLVMGFGLQVVIGTLLLASALRIQAGKGRAS